jgi:hypothetical protein
VLVGGFDVTGYLDDSWVGVVGATWAPRAPAARPRARAGHALCYDIVRQRAVLFGGHDNNALLGDTWEWDGRDWTVQSPASSPPARTGHALVYDLGRQRVVLFGGDQGAGFGDDTWEWDGVAWLQQSFVTAPPGGAVALAYDERRGRSVWFGGRFCSRGGCFPRGQDTWFYGGLTPAATRVLGNGCAGTSGVPVLTTGVPFLGNAAFAADLVSAHGSAPCGFLFATGTQSLPIGGGCRLHVDGVLVPLLGATNASGFASIAIPLPDDPALRRAVVYAQGVVVDPSGAFAGLALSAGLQLVLGD